MPNVQQVARNWQPIKLFQFGVVSVTFIEKKAAVSVLRDDPILWMKVEDFGHDPDRTYTEWAYRTWGPSGVEAITGRWVMIVDSPPGGQFEVSVRKLAACYVYAPLQAAA